MRGLTRNIIHHRQTDTMNNNDKEKKKRDHVSELQEYTARKRKDLEHPGRLSVLVEAYLVASNLPDESPLKREFSRHIIVSLVAWMQDRFREMIKTAIDSKDARNEVMPEFPEVKITIDLVRNLMNQKFTLGDFFAHLYSVSSHQGVNASFKSAYGISFYDSMKQYHLDFVGESPKDSASLNDSFVVGFEKLYCNRNVLAHEEARDFHITDIELYEFIRIGIVFESFEAQLRSNKFASI